MVFIELPIFVRCASDLFSDDELADVQKTLLNNPSAGDLIPGGRGLRKIRVPLSGRGKRGGARIIYYYWISQAHCYLVYAYAKNATANLTQEQLRKLAAMIDAEVKNE